MKVIVTVYVSVTVGRYVHVMVGEEYVHVAEEEITLTEVDPKTL